MLTGNNRVYNRLQTPKTRRMLIVLRQTERNEPQRNTNTILQGAVTGLAEEFAGQENES
jgi:hypothetical protein